MSKDYRDPLAAALSRIELLERENARLKNVQGGRPPTAEELEAVRHESELSRLERQWEAIQRKDAENAWALLDGRQIRASKIAHRIFVLIPGGS